MSAGKEAMLQKNAERMSASSKAAAMVDDAQEHSKTGNAFLDALSQDVRGSLAPKLRRIAVARGDTVEDVDRPIDRVVFPLGSIVSLVTRMLDGGTVEVGIIGREGMSGLPIALGDGIAWQHGFVQVADSALCMDARDFESCLHEHPDLQAACLRYARAVLSRTAQFAACNRLHPVNERCARWLLMAHDRVPSDSFALTQEFLSDMLGVRRAGVSVAASALQRAGLIDYRQGQVTVLDRTTLESAACECYLAVEEDWQKTMGFSIRKTA